MATTIKSTKLDFDNIKTELKNFIAEQDEFSDYNFEASGLSNILDVLAYNTHFNALIANMVLNESYLPTAQIRNSVVSIAEGMGYIPNSKTSSKATVRLTVNLAGQSNPPTTLSIPAFTKFTTSIDGISYTFQTIETMVAANNGSGSYTFHRSGTDDDVTIYEGLYRSKTFLVGQKSTNVVYVVPDDSMDISTAIIKVFSSPASSNSIAYTDLTKATTIDEASALYILKESPNQFYELSFGIGGSFGVQPQPGNKIEVEYIRATGPAANGAGTFDAVSELYVSQLAANFPITVTTVSPSAGGSEREDIESIRKNAPFQYASQNRMVTPLDYSALILKNHAGVIDDIKSWGGETHDKPEYGTVFTSIRFKDNLPSSVINTTKQDITELANSFSVVSFDLKFLDPEIIYLSINTVFRFNPSLTSFSKNTVVGQVEDAMRDYFEANTGRFDDVFRRSNLLTLIDDTDPSVLSSRASVRMNKRIYPVLTLKENHLISFPVEIESPTLATETSYGNDVTYVTNADYQKIDSTRFVVGNQTVKIRNTLNERETISSNQNEKEYVIVPSTNLELYNPGTGEIVNDSIGYFDPSTGEVHLSGLEVQTILDGKNYIKIIAIPANQSVVPVTRNQVVTFDEELSNSQAYIVSTT
jgi:hypothetical protein